MKIELRTDQRSDALASLKRYVEANLDAEPLGDLRAGLMFDFFLDEIGPAVYNKAVEDAQARIQSRAADLTGELFQDEFPYWPRQRSRRK